MIIVFLQFREILFVDETTGEKAFFTYKLSSPLTAAGNYGAQLPGLWVGGGIADTSYEYQLLICNTDFYSGFFISKYTNCYKQCHSWCSDTTSPYFRSASTASGYAGVAFNVNGHRPLSSRLISVGLRWITWRGNWSSSINRRSFMLWDVVTKCLYCHSLASELDYE